jgi:hypothetical protein
MNKGDKTMKKISPLLLILLVTALVFQAGFAVYANVINESNTSISDNTQDTSTEINTEISQEVLDKIQASDPENYEQNVANYKHLLVSLNVHSLFKKEIERLIIEGYSLPDLLIGYEFLYQHHGTVSDLNNFMRQKSSEAGWEDIFTNYNAAKEEFIPRAFDPIYLEDLMSRPSLSSDDIMIVDLVSFYTDKTFAELIELRQFPAEWNNKLAELGFLYNAETLPRVQITTEQLDKYVGQNGLSEDQVAEAFVIAHKLGKEAKVVIEKIKAGNTEEGIFAESFIEQYN